MTWQNKLTKIVIAGVIYATAAITLNYISNQIEANHLILQNYVSFLIVGIILVFQLNYINIQTSFGFKTSIIYLWLILFTIRTLLNMIEYYFYSTSSAYEILSLTLQNMLLDIILILSLTPIFKQPAKQQNSLSQKLKEYSRKRRPISLMLRYLICIISFILIYLLFGIIFSPLILPYYQNSNLNLTIPPIQTILTLQILRATIYLIILTPIIAAKRDKGPSS